MPALGATPSGPGRLYRTLWHYAGADRPRVAAFMTMLILAQLVKLAIPYLTGIAVDAVQRGGDSALGNAAWDMALIFIACVASWGLHGPARVIERFVAIRVRERFADALYGKATSLPLDWHENHHSGETIERVQKAGGALFGFAQNQFIYLQNGVSLVGPIVAIFLLSLSTGVAALGAYVLIALMLVRFDRLMIRLNRAHNQAQGRYAAALVDCLGNIATVLTLRLQEPTRRLLSAKLAETFAPLRSGIVANEAKWCAVDLLNAAIRCGLVVLYCWLTRRQGEGVLLGSAVMVYQYAQQVGGVVSNMAGNYQDLVGYHVDLDGVAGIAAAVPRDRGEGGRIPESWREIAIVGLDFSYPSGRPGRAALDGIALQLCRGERIAVVGASGSGKSTLLRVLAGLYPPARVDIALDGTPRADLRHLGSIALLAPQEPEVFAGSLRHNLTVGIEQDAESVLRACDLAAFTPVIEALPAGLDTDVAERGLTLSGGQKQRLALARAILATGDASLILLDEPTSSLDPVTEALVYANLLAAWPDACIISSMHRLHLLDRFDRIVVMEEGRIAGVGTTNELLETIPSFRELWQRYAAARKKLEGEMPPRLVAVAGGSRD